MSIKTKKIAVLFSGSGSNVEAILAKLHGQIFENTKIEVALTLTNNPNAKGIEKASKYGLTSVVINHKNFSSREEFDKALVSEIKKYDVNLVVLAGFMRVLTPVFTENLKAINLHPSILPLFKGAYAIDESFNSDMQVGGISIHAVSSELDGGKIIAQKTFQRDNKTLQEWESEIHRLEHELLPQTIVEILTGRVEI